MSQSSSLKPLAIALGAMFTGSLTAGTALAADNPFAQTELSGGYQVAEKAVDGRCGGMKSGMEGMCGMKALDTDGNGKITKEEFTAHHEAMFKQADTNADGVMDADEHDKLMGGVMPGGKNMMEGKCGAGMMGK